MQILIVGAGIAGLSLAKALEQHGIAVDLVERQTGELAVGAGLDLVGNATRALERNRRHDDQSEAPDLCGEATI